MRDVNVSAQLDIVARAGHAPFGHSVGLGGAVGVVGRGGGDGRNGPLIARHERDLGPVHRRLLALERLVHVRPRARLHRPTARRLVAGTCAVLAGESAADAVEQGPEAGQTGADDAEVMLRFGPVRDRNVGPCCGKDLFNRKLFFQYRYQIESGGRVLT